MMKLRTKDKVLSQNKLFSMYPNPSAGNSTIEYSLDKEGFVMIYISDASGKMLKVYLLEKNHPRGKFNLDLDVSDLPNGLYMTTMEINGNINTQKIIINQ